MYGSKLQCPKPGGGKSKKCEQAGGAGTRAAGRCSKFPRAQLSAGSLVKNLGPNEQRALIPHTVE